MNSGHPAANGDFHNSEAQNSRNNYTLPGINGGSYDANFGQSHNTTPISNPSEYYFPESYNNPPISWSFNDPSGSAPAPTGLSSMEQYSNIVPNNFMNPSVALMDPQYFFSGSTNMSQGLNSNSMMNSMQFRPQFTPYSMSHSSISTAKNLPSTSLNSQTLSRLQGAPHNMPFQSNFQDTEPQVLYPGLTPAQKLLLQQAQASQLAKQRLNSSSNFGNGPPHQLGNNQRTFSASSHDSLQLPPRTHSSLDNNDLMNLQKRGRSTEDNDPNKGLDSSMQSSKLNSQGILNEPSQGLYSNKLPGNNHQMNDRNSSMNNILHATQSSLRNSNETSQENHHITNKDSSQSYLYDSSNNTPKDLSQDTILTQPISTQNNPSQPQPPITNHAKLELLRKKSLENRQDFFKILETVSEGEFDPAKIVICCDQPVDLHALWIQVISRGGLVSCGKTKGWGAVRDILGLDATQSKVPGRLKVIWKKYLQGLESALYPSQSLNLNAKKYKKTHSSQLSGSQQPEGIPNLEPTQALTSSAVSSIDIKPPAISYSNLPPVNPPTSNQTSHEEVPKAPPAKPKVVHPPRTAPYDYIPFFRKVETYGGIDVSSFQASTGTDYGMLTGEIRIHDITMALQSCLPSCVSQALFVLVNLSYDPTVALILSQCQHLTQTLILLLLEDFETLSDSSQVSKLKSEKCSESDTLSISLHKDLCRQFTDEALYLPDFQINTSLFSFNSSQRAALVCLIISNLSFIPANQPFLAEQIDLIIIMFRFSHTTFLNSLGEMISIRKYLLILLSNVLEFWRVEKESETIKFDNKLLFKWVFDLCCEFFDQSLPLYPSLAWECLVKITTLDTHRDLLGTSRFTDSCTTIVNYMSSHLQRFFSRLDEEPFDETRIIHLQYILMSAPHFIKAASTIPHGLINALSGIVTWLINTEITERQSRHFKPKGSISRSINSQAEEREASLVGLIVRGLSSMQALYQRSSVSQDSGSMLTHQSTIVELLTLPMLHPHVATQINLLLQPVVEFMNQSPSRNQSFKNEIS